MKKVFIRGNKERGSEVIKMLEDLGGVNSLYCAGARETLLYYINKHNHIDSVSFRGELGTIIQECFEELYLPESIKELPNTWEKWVELNSKVADEYFIAGGCTINRMNLERRASYIDANLLATQEDAKAILALIKLKRLRDTYRQGWIPNWKTKDDKYSIEHIAGVLCICGHPSVTRFLSFQSEEIRDKFYVNFKNLIEQAKEFI